jgi:hypothetical protein
LVVVTDLNRTLGREGENRQWRFGRE